MEQKTKINQLSAQDDIAGYILSGGKNRRMGGRKKLFLEYNKTPFYCHILTAMSPLKTIYLSVDTPKPYESAGLPLITDRYPETGPLGAVCTGLEVCPQQAIFAAACDMPFLDVKTVELLIREYRQHPGIIITRSGGTLLPFPGIYPKEALPVFLNQLKAGRRTMTEAIEKAGCKVIALEKGNRAGININTPDEYRRLTAPDSKSRPFIFAVSGYKNSGKTTLLTRLIPELKRRGYKVAVIKHDGHDFQSDVPGTDSYRFQQAGACGTAVYSSSRLMVTKEYREPTEKMLIEAFSDADIILIEGLKDSSYPKYICGFPDRKRISAAELADRIEALKGEAGVKPPPQPDKD